MRTIKKRRKQGITDYRARINMLKSRTPRIVARISNRHVTAQYVKSREAKDLVSVGVNSKILLDCGWPEAKKGSLKSKSAAYLTGFLLGKKIADKEGRDVKAIMDTGLKRSVGKSRIYAVIKGLIDAGIKINCKKEMLPELVEDKEINTDKIKKEIEKL